MTEQDQPIQDAAARTELDIPNSKGFDFIPAGSIAESLGTIPSEIPDGKNVVVLGSPEARAALIIDKDSEITTYENGVTKSRIITAEIHDTDTDIIIGQVGELIVVIGNKLANSRPTTNDDGSVKFGETVGDGVIDGEIFRIKTGDKLLIHAGMAHVHGTEPGKVAAATFIKRKEMPQSNPA